MTGLDDIWAAFQDNDGWGRVGEHVVLSAVPLGIAAAIGIPLGILATKAGRGGSFVIGATAFTGRMVPTLAAMALVMSLTSIGFWPAVVGLVLLALPSVLLNTATGIHEADRHAVDAARGMGYTNAQVLGRLELPLALPHIATGLRTAAVLIVATAALAGVIGANGLGVTIAAGFSNNQNDVLLAGAIPVTLLAMLAEALLATLQWLVTPTGLRRSARRVPTTTGRSA